MKNPKLSLAVFLVSFGALLASARDAAAQADPIAIVVNRGSDALDVIEVSGMPRTWAPFASGSLGSRPTDIVYDEKSGRIYVSQTGSVAGFNGRLPDGRDFVSIPATGKGSGIALDPVGRRVFVSYRSDSDAQTNGLVNEISIANPAAPVVTQRVVPGLPDLEFIAWDARNQRVYVVEEDGRVGRTDNGGWNWTGLGRIASTGGGGILADPNGGVWISGRNPAALVRATTTDAVATYTMAAATNPRGLVFDPADPGAILIAVDDIARIKKYTIATNTFANVMSTDTRPQDVVKTKSGWVVSANRLSGNGTPGNASINTPLSLPVNTNRTVALNIEPRALVAIEMPRLNAEPKSGAYQYCRTGNSSTMTFGLQNTRANRTRMDLGAVTVAGLNPVNYVLTGANTCNAARLNWGDSCSFTLRFTATPPSNQPPPTLPGTIPIAYWPAEARITSTDGSATAIIPLRSNLNLSTCFGVWPR